MRYYAFVGIIDFFELTFDKKELAIRLTNDDIFLADDEGNTFENCYSLDKMNSIEKIEEQIREIVFKEEKEYPHTIRYFAIPNPNYCDFDIGAVAKVSNNGSTYIFTPNIDYLKVIAKEYGPIKTI